jgi:nucleotide sugar dehydrogenase
MLSIKPEEIDTAEKRSKYTICVIGCRQTGILHTYLFAEAGFKIRCVDADQVAVSNITRGKLPFVKREVERQLRNYARIGALNATTDIKAAVSQSDVIVIAVPVKVDKKKKADYSNLESICKAVGSNLRSGSIVINASVVGVGVTQGLIKENLENASGLKAGPDFALAYSPIRSSNAHILEPMSNHQRIVAATDKNSLNATTTILGSIATNVKTSDSIKIAEAVALFGIILRDVNSALAKELAFFCEKADLDYTEALKLASSEPSPTSLPALVNDSASEESHLLLDDAENLNLKFRIPTVARETNEGISRHAVNLVKDALRNCGKPLRRTKISLLGISQKPNVESPLKKTAETLIKMLEARGVKTSWYDPHLSGEELTEMQSRVKKNMTEALEGMDCIVILTGHDQFKRLNLKRLKVMMRMPAAIVDLEGVVEPSKVEKEGFIFRGLGRGVWTK